MSFLLPCFRYRWRPSLLLLCCRGSFQASSCRRPCLLVCLFGCFQCRQLPPALCLLPGFQLPPGLCCRGPGFLLCCRYASRLPAAADQERPPGYFSINSICFYAAGVFSFLDPVKLPGIEALYQTIYNYNICKTIQDHFFQVVFSCFQVKRSHL